MNVYIEYDNLYKFVEEMKKDSNIKTIEQYISRMRSYLINSLDKTINAYLNSNEMLVKH